VAIRFTHLDKELERELAREIMEIQRGSHRGVISGGVKGLAPEKQAPRFPSLDGRG